MYDTADTALSSRYPHTLTLYTRLEYSVVFRHQTTQAQSPDSGGSVNKIITHSYWEISGIGIVIFSSIYCDIYIYYDIISYTW